MALLASINSFAQSNQNTSNSMYGSSQSSIGQALALSAGGVLNMIQFSLEKVGAPTGTIIVRVYNITGTIGTNAVPTGSAIANSNTIDVSTLPTGGFSLIPFFFSGTNKITLTNGQQLAIAVEYTGGDASDYVNVGSQNGLTGVNGVYTSAGFTWNTTTTFEQIFSIYANGSSSITLDNLVPFENLNAATSYSFSMKVNSGSNSILIVAFNAFSQVNANDSVVNSVKFNGVNLTRAATQYITDNSTFNTSYDIWYLINPPATTANVVFDFTGGSDGGGLTSLHAYAASFFGIAQASPLDATFAAWNQVARTNHSDSVTTTVNNELIVDTLGLDSTAFSISGVQVPFATVTDSGDRGSGDIATTAGSHTMGWTTGSSFTDVHVIASFKPAVLSTTPVYAAGNVSQPTIKSTIRTF